MRSKRVISRVGRILSILSISAEMRESIVPVAAYGLAEASRGRTRVSNLVTKFSRACVIVMIDAAARSP